MKSAANTDEQKIKPDSLYVRPAAPRNSRQASYEAERADLMAGYRGELERRRETYQREEAQTQEDASRSLRERYVASKTSARQLPQVLQAVGLTGGVARDAARADRAGYGKARESLEEERDRQLAALEETFLHGNAGDRESYQLRLNQLNRRYKKALDSIV